MHHAAPAHEEPPVPQPPRMLWWVLASVFLVLVSMHLQDEYPGSVLAVTAYKAHLLALGGWGGYWLDRALFPYDRPHEYLQPEPLPMLPPGLDARDAAQAYAGSDDDASLPPDAPLLQVTTASFGHAMLRRAIVVAACLVCVGLGA